MMNGTRRTDSFGEAFFKNFLAVFLCVIINSINISFVYIFIRSQDFQKDPRYVLYIHLVVNDIIMLTGAILMLVLTYATVRRINVTFCCVTLVTMETTDKNSSINLACMAVERYIAVCWPLHHPQACTMGRTYALIAFIWSVSFLSAIADFIIVVMTHPLSFFSLTMNCYIDAIYTTRQHKDKAIGTQVFLVSMVLLTLIITYLKVILAARKASGDDQASIRKARNTILLHGLQLMIYLLSYATPFINMQLARFVPTKVLFANFIFTTVLPRFLNPLIYGMRDQKFSTQVRLLLYSCRRCGPGPGERLTPTAGERVRPTGGDGGRVMVGGRGSSKKMRR